MHKLSVWTVTLTFDLGTWFLHTTHRLVVKNNFQIPPIFGIMLSVAQDSGKPKPKVSAVILTFDLGHGSYTCHIVWSR